MGFKSLNGIRFAKLRRSIPDVVGADQCALWNIDSSSWLEALRKESAKQIGRRLNDKEFIALVRGKMQCLFGKPSTIRNKGNDTSFTYDIKAILNNQKVYFSLGDQRAEKIVLLWEFSTSDKDVRNKVKLAFFELLSKAVPADFSDAFSCEDDILIGYGIEGGLPWTEMEVSMNLKKRLFQNSMKSIQEKQYRMERYLISVVPKIERDKVPFLGNMTVLR